MRKQGFTLLEMSVVLVIIALVIGGVLVGRDLVAGAQLRALISEIEGLEASIATFEIKYNCLPGDCSRASQFGLGTNGNGDSSISIVPESFYAFRHLGESRLINGSYSGISGPGTGCGSSCDAVVGVNVPRTSFENVSFMFIPGREMLSTTSFPRARSRSQNFISIGADLTNWYPNSAFLQTRDALLLDQKIDDGIALNGRLTPWKRDFCTNTYDDVTAVYDTSITDRVRCSFFYELSN